MRKSISEGELHMFMTRLLEEIRNLLNERLTVPPRRWLRPNEVYRMLKISPTTLIVFRDKGFLPFTKIGNVVLYEYNDIIKLLESNKMPGPDKDQGGQGV